VHLFRPSLSFLAEAQPRHFLPEVHIKNFCELIGKITNLFCTYLFQMAEFINAY
jgi:hypothetical protein